MIRAIREVVPERGAEAVGVIATARVEAAA